VSDQNYCSHCSSAGSIEFGMCQVCLKDYSRNETYFGGRSQSALAFYHHPQTGEAHSPGSFDFTRRMMEMVSSSMET
jgi:hypothetical protein